MLKSIKESTIELREFYNKWKRSKKLSVLAIKISIFEHLLSELLNTKKDKELIGALVKRY